MLGMLSARKNVLEERQFSYNDCVRKEKGKERKRIEDLYKQAKVRRIF